MRALYEAVAPRAMTRQVMAGATTQAHPGAMSERSPSTSSATSASPATSAPPPLAMNLEAWSQWLVVWFWIVGAISVAMIAVPQVSGELFDLALFGSTDRPAGFTSDAVDYQRFIWGVSGAITIGWLLLAAAVVRGPFRRGDAWAWRALATSFCGWFLIDSTLSIWFGFAENVAVNVLFVIGMVPAMVRTAPGSGGERAH